MTKIPLHSSCQDTAHGIGSGNSCCLGPVSYDRFLSPFTHTQHSAAQAVDASEPSAGSQGSLGSAATTLAALQVLDHGSANGSGSFGASSTGSAIPFINSTQSGSHAHVGVGAHCQAGGKPQPAVGAAGM